VSSILVCEDHATIRALVGELLAGDGHTVVACASVGEALAGIAAASPDLVLADLHLRGGESARELIARLRADSDLAGVPIVLMSGEFDGASGAYAARFAADATISKPFDPEELLTLVNGLLERPPDRG